MAYKKHIALRGEPELPDWERKRDAQRASAGVPDDQGLSQHDQKRKKRPAKIPRTKGACVWDGNAMGLPPVAFVIRDVWEDKGDATRAASTSLYVESLESERTWRTWRRTSEVSNFDEQLRMIYGERRGMLTERGLWSETVAMVKRALFHRLLLLPNLRTERRARLRCG